MKLKTINILFISAISLMTVVMFVIMWLDYHDGDHVFKIHKYIEFSGKVASMLIWFCVFRVLAQLNESK